MNRNFFTEKIYYFTKYPLREYEQTYCIIDFHFTNYKKIATMNHLLIKVKKLIQSNLIYIIYII